MDGASFWIAGVMVYAAVGVFLAGMAYRLYRWRAVPASPMRLETFPKLSGGPRTLRVVVDTLFFPQVAEVNPGLWLGAILFHVALAGVFMGHLHLLGRFPGQLEAMMSAGAGAIGGAMGVLWALAALYLLIRRFRTPIKEVSTPEDYLLLLLILGVVVMGDHLRFFAHIDVAEYQRYVQSLLALKPALGPAITGSPARVSFLAHLFLANLLLMYLPFSKLVHFAGAFFTNGIRRG